MEIKNKKVLKNAPTGHTRARAREAETQKTVRRVESEKTLEARLVREIEKMGGMALKFTSQFHRGIPDRIVLMPEGQTYFVEMKSTGKKPTALQVYAMKELTDLGFSCYVVDSTERLDEVLHNLQDGQKLTESVN